MVTIVKPAPAPTERSPGMPLQVNDIWFQTGPAGPGGGLIHRYDGSGFVTITSTVSRAISPPGSPIIGDTFVHSATGAKARYNGTAWDWVEPIVGLPTGGNTSEHLEKAGERDFDTSWVDAAEGIAFLYHRITHSAAWSIQHGMRSKTLNVICIDDTRIPNVIMYPRIEFYNNRCDLFFKRAVGGYAVLHASKPNPDEIG